MTGLRLWTRLRLLLGGALAVHVDAGPTAHGSGIVVTTEIGVDGPWPWHGERQVAKWAWEWAIVSAKEAKKAEKAQARFARGTGPWVGHA